MRGIKPNHCLLTFSTVAVTYYTLLHFLQVAPGNHTRSSNKALLDYLPSLFRSQPLHTTIQVLRIQHSNRTTKSSARVEVVSYKELNNQFHAICSYRRWQEIREPCVRNLSWEDRPKDKRLRSSVLFSVVEVLARPLGFPSVVRIETKDLSGKWKTQGGDFWDVKLYGDDDLVMNVEMTDHANGSYTGYFYVPEDLYDGDDNVELLLKCVLESSQCNGMRDPPDFWFQKGKK